MPEVHDSPPALRLQDVTAGYGRTTVLRDVELSVPAGSIVALLGPNGAGKTTTLSVAGGLVQARSGQVLAAGQTITRLKPFERAGVGLCLIPEGRGVFPNLSVRENLRLYLPTRGSAKDAYEPALEAFPVLADRLDQKAASLSGGQQQMLALARCFLAGPKVALLDEVSMGLAPRIVDEIFDALLTLRDRGVALLLVEQYVDRALEIADRVYLLGRGTITFSGTPSEIDREEIMGRYVNDERVSERPS